MANNANLAPAAPVGGVSAPAAAGAMARSKVQLLGLYLVASFLIQIILLIGFWPANGAPATKSFNYYCPWTEGGCTLDVTAEGMMIVIVLLAGGVGAMVHAIRSFSAHLGAQRLTDGWGWWYFLRPLEGAVVALAFYMVLGGGLVQTGTSNSAETSIYGMAGVSVLVGMFSHQAVTKLKEVAETFFSKASSAVSDHPSEKLLPKPSVTQVEPPVVKQGEPAAKIKVVGTGFTEQSTGRIQGTERITEFNSSTEIFVVLSANDTREANRDLSVSVFNPGPGGGESIEDRKVRIVAG